MARLKAGDLGGPLLDRNQYLRLRNETVEGNPRVTEEYRAACCEAVGLGSVPDPERYGHLQHQDDDGLLRWVVCRASGCFWMKDSPRTCVKGFRHRLITRGPPVRVGLHRLNRPDTEWVEKAIQEDVARGQLIPGSSLWGAARPSRPRRAQTTRPFGGAGGSSSTTGLSTG